LIISLLVVAVMVALQLAVVVAQVDIAQEQIILLLLVTHML
jgi:hypothetical protein